MYGNSYRFRAGYIKKNYHSKVRDKVPLKMPVAVCYSFFQRNWTQAPRCVTDVVVKVLITSIFIVKKTTVRDLRTVEILFAKQIYNFKYNN